MKMFPFSFSGIVPSRSRERIPKGRKKKIIEAVLEARRAGKTLREAAGAGGIDVATLCRWQRSEPSLKADLQAAKAEAKKNREDIKYRPIVYWRKDCPECRAKVVVRTTSGGVRFWRCGRWPLCEWASWRPRAPRDCRRCGGPRFYLFRANKTPTNWCSK